MTIPHVLRAAAERIERDGWCQGKPTDGTRCCAVRAIVMAGESSFGTSLAIEAVRDFIGCNTYGVIHWNDTPGRTVDEVLAALRSAADAVERGES